MMEASAEFLSAEGPPPQGAHGALEAPSCAAKSYQLPGKNNTNGDSENNNNNNNNNNNSNLVLGDTASIYNQLFQYPQNNKSLVACPTMDLPTLKMSNVFPPWRVSKLPNFNKGFLWISGMLSQLRFPQCLNATEFCFQVNLSLPNSK